MQLTSTVNPKRAACLAAGALAFAALVGSHAAYAATFKVTTGLDSGAGSLRAAVAAANASAGADTIAFAIGGSGVHVITLTSGALPQLTGPVAIDGTTEPGYGSAPIVEIRNGTGQSSLVGLDLAGGQSTVRGLSITGWRTAVELEGPGNDLVAGDRIGIDVTGAQRSNGTGVLVATTSAASSVGDCTAAGRNVISASSTGIELQSGSAYVFGNYVGTNITGTAAAANGIGIEAQAASGPGWIGSGDPGCGNVVSGNTIGVFLGGATKTHVAGNLVGTAKNGSAAIPNGTGIDLYGGASGNTIGGTAAADGNVVSGNTQVGILIAGAGTSGNVVERNLVGTTATGATALPNGAGLQLGLGATGNTVGASGFGNVVSGNAGSGVTITDSGTSGNVLAGNLIGTNASGTGPLPNATGVLVAGGASSNVVGATTLGGANLISGNTSVGVHLTGALTASNVVEGNYVGPDVSGAAALPGTQIGVLLDGGASSNTIGGASASARNVISGNGGLGVELKDAATSGNVIAGDYIGTNAAGTAALLNGSVFTPAIQIWQAASTTIGGMTAGARDVLVGNGGVDVQSGSGTVIEGDYIGTNAAGTAALGGLYGVSVDPAATGAVVGGIVAGSGNTLSGLGTGVLLNGCTGAVVAGNRIGTNAAGTAALPNANGIALLGASGNMVGGTTAGARNLVSGNTKVGVLLSGAGTHGNVVEGNRVGTDATGTAAIPNATGIEVVAGANANTIGGTSSGTRNLVSGNSGNRISLHDAGTSGNLVEGNRIGTDAAGTAPLGNFNGVVANGGASGNVVGGTSAGDANAVAFNGVYGVYVGDQTSVGDSIERNSIFGNGVAGILLQGGGNHAQAAPAIASVTTDAAATTIRLSLAGFAPSTGFRLEVFLSSGCGAGQGKTFLGARTVTTDAGGVATASLSVSPVAAGQRLTATATSKATGDTSAFSACAVTP